MNQQQELDQKELALQAQLDEASDKLNEAMANYGETVPVNTEIPEEVANAAVETEGGSHD